LCAAVAFLDIVLAVESLIVCAFDARETKKAANIGDCKSADKAAFVAANWMFLLAILLDAGLILASYFLLENQRTAIKIAKQDERRNLDMDQPTFQKELAAETAEKEIIAKGR